MKKIFTLLFFATSFLYAQSNSEIAEIYLQKSEGELKKKELKKALVYFDKATALLGDKTTAKVEEIGTMIYFNLENFDVAKEHAKNYFALSKDKGSDRYNEVLFLYVEIEERIEEKNEIKAELLELELLRMKQLTRLDSLTKVWYSKSELLTMALDTIYKFDKNGIAVFKNNKDFYGVLDDQGNELVNPGAYVNYKHYDGKIVLLEGSKDQATKIMIYDTSNKVKRILPAVSEFNALSTNYGKVMFPRENGLVITYPNNSKKVLVYDLNLGSFKTAVNLERYYNYWKVLKVIRKFNKENQIKIDKEYLDFGGNLGGYSSFYNEDGSLFGFISNGGTLITSNQYKYLGTLSNGVLEAVKTDGTVVWINEKGAVVEASVNKNGTYAGTTILKKVNSKFQFVNEKNEIMKNGEVLESLDQFLKTN